MLLTKNEYGQVHQVELSKNISILEIKHTNTTAKISLYGGQVLSWQPTGEKEVFWLSQTSNFAQGKAIRGGIPLCWPWFGAHPDDIESKMDNHGFARTQQWQVDNININEQGIEICLGWQGENINPLWPFNCVLKQMLFFGKTFKQVLQMENLSDTDAYYTGALHSYFAVGSPSNIKIKGFEQASYFDKLTAQQNEPQSLIINGVGPVDRVYDTNRVTTIIDNNWHRAIELKASNTHQWVFWNPGAKLANNMADIHVNGEQEFVCLEAANTNGQLLAAGQRVSMAQEISIRRE